MATTSDSPELDDHSIDIPKVIGDGDAGQEATMVRPSRAFDYVELPLGIAVSTPCSSEGGLQRLWEGGLFDVSEHSDVTLRTAWYASSSSSSSFLNGKSDGASAFCSG